MEIFEWGTRPPWTNAELMISRVTVFLLLNIFYNIGKRKGGKGILAAVPLFISTIATTCSFASSTNQNTFFKSDSDSNFKLS